MAAPKTNGTKPEPKDPPVIPRGEFWLRGAKANDWETTFNSDWTIEQIVANASTTFGAVARDLHPRDSISGPWGDKFLELRVVHAQPGHVVVGVVACADMPRANVDAVSTLNLPPGFSAQIEGDSGWVIRRNGEVFAKQTNHPTDLTSLQRCANYVWNHAAVRGNPTPTYYG